MANTTGKRIFIIAGPNGAGKSTFAKEFLPNEANCPNFVNADLIAEGVSPFRSGAVAVAVGRLMLNEICEHVRKGNSFAFETTLNGRTYARRIPQWQDQGYLVKLIFLVLPTPEDAIERVSRRVTEGGHDVPNAVIRRRFHAGRRNFEELYRHSVDSYVLYDNSSDTPVLLAKGNRR